MCSVIGTVASTWKCTLWILKKHSTQSLMTFECQRLEFFREIIRKILHQCKSIWGWYCPGLKLFEKFSWVHHICVSCHSGANNNLHVNVLVLSKRQMEKRSRIHRPAVGSWYTHYTIPNGTRWLQFLFDLSVGVVMCRSRKEVVIIVPKFLSKNNNCTM